MPITRANKRQNAPSPQAISSPSSPRSITSIVNDTLSFANSEAPPGVPKGFWDSISRLLITLSTTIEQLSSSTSMCKCSSVTLTPVPDPAQVLQPSESDIERHNRLRSLVICGLSESSDPNPSFRMEQDEVNVASLLAALNLEVRAQTVFRMGKPSDRPRLLKVLLPTRGHLLKALQAASTLRSSPAWNGIFIRKSMTTSERDDWRKMRAELASLKKSHPEEGWVIYRDQLWKKKDIAANKRNSSPSN